MSFVSFFKPKSQTGAGVLETLPSPQWEKHISSNWTITTEAEGGGGLVAKMHFKLIIALDTLGWYFSVRDTVTPLDTQTKKLIKAHGILRINVRAEQMPISVTKCKYSM